MPARPFTIREWLSLAFLSIAFALVCYLVFTGSRTQWNWSGVWEYRALLLRGFGVTLLVSLGSLVLSILLGLALALAQQGGNRPWAWFARTFTEVIRGTPLLVQLLIGYYLVFPALKLDTALVAMHRDERFFAGVLILSCFTGAYLGEIFRAGIASVGASQWEAARAAGLTTRQTYRHIILPQSIQRVLPALAGQSASLVKDSSLLSVIGLAELTHETQGFISNTYSTLEGYVPLAVAYLMITLPLSLWARWLERKFSYES